MSEILDLAVHQKHGLETGIPVSLRSYRDPLFDLVPIPCRKVVEIGSQQGWFAWRVMKQLLDASLYCVDPWEGLTCDGDGRYNFQCWLKNLEDYIGRRVWPVRRKSQVEAEELSSPIEQDVDFLFIDGDHREEAIYADLKGWTRVVRPGGLVMGHDWGGKSGWGPGVRRAVRKFRSDFPGYGGKELHTGAVFNYDGTRLTHCFWWYME